MSYQIVDNGANIRFVGDSGELLIIKRSVQAISVVRDDIIQINTGHPLRNYFFRWKDVYDPAVSTAIDLRNFIAGLITV